MSINIIKNTNFGTHNTTYGRQKPQHIVMHYTASNGGAAANHISCFNNHSTTNASADYFVDESDICQYNMQMASTPDKARVTAIPTSGGITFYLLRTSNVSNTSVDWVAVGVSA